MRILLLLIAGLAIVGCGPRGMTPEEKLERLLDDVKTTYPVKGEVTIDGKPQKDIWVYLVPKGEKLPKGDQPAQRGLTKEDGTFAITTYIEGDGAPAGDYVICIEKLRHRQTGSSWVGPDQLGKKYNDPEKSEFTVTVDAGPVTVPKIDLSTAGVVVEAPGKGGGAQRDRNR